MVVERRGDFRESVRAGVPLPRVLLGERTWFELRPGTQLDNLTVIDENTVEVIVHHIPGDHKSFGQIHSKRMTGNKIDLTAEDGSRIRWRPSSETVVDLLGLLGEVTGALERGAQLLCAGDALDSQPPSEGNINITRKTGELVAEFRTFTGKLATALPSGEVVDQIKLVDERRDYEGETIFG